MVFFDEPEADGFRQSPGPMARHQTATGPLALLGKDGTSSSPKCFSSSARRREFGNTDRTIGYFRPSKAFSFNAFMYQHKSGPIPYDDL